MPARLAELLATPVDQMAPAPQDRGLALRRLRDDDLSVLVRLFLICAPTLRADVERLDPSLLTDLLAMNLVEASGEDTYEAGVQFVPYDELLLAVDAENEDSPLARRDAIEAIHPPSRLLAKLTPRRSVDDALDLGAGCGVHALLAARHSARVTAVDINPRAGSFVHFNAALNGVDNVVTRTGSWLDPVDGEMFDLIVCNPPFLISPDGTYVYRDSGREGDDLSRLLVRNIPSRLREDGTSLILISWIIRETDAHWSRPVREWVSAAPGGAAWLLLSSLRRPVDAAAAGVRGLQWFDRDEYLSAVDRWSSYYRTLEASAIATGVFAFMRHSGVSSFHADRFIASDVRSGADCAAVLDAQRRLATMNDRDLLAAPMRPAAHVRLNTSNVFEHGAWVQEDSIATDFGFRFGGPVDRATFDVIQSLGSERTLAEAIAVATKSGGDIDAITAIGVPFVRRMLALGMIGFA